MRYFRAVGATALATATGLTLLGTSIAGGTAEAAPASLYAPSALVLTVGAGESPATATALRAVTLTCAPTPGGTHPDPEAACAELAAADGDFDRLTVLPADRPCTREWDPVTVTGDGVWQGQRVSWEATYGNPCDFRARTAESAALSF
ncbi:subtilase-type protease inhibitor [Streptomyces sp. NPDC012769]|uniref:subtilase-type protease inhibitor n=1 Tax=Streptomyces sp. NPDC012769 TaxID=3364848 RepID=UPI0036B8CEE6